MIWQVISFFQIIRLDFRVTLLPCFLLLFIFTLIYVFLFFRKTRQIVAIWRLVLIHETQCNGQLLLFLWKTQRMYKLLCLRYWTLYFRVVATHDLYLNIIKKKNKNKKQKKRLLKSIKVSLENNETKSNSMVANVIKISQKMKNKS